MHWSFKHYDGLTRDELYEILRLRCQVFIVEQDCVYDDVDGLKTAAAWHLLARDGRGKLCAGLRSNPAQRRKRARAPGARRRPPGLPGRAASAATWSAAGWKQRA